MTLTLKLTILAAVLALDLAACAVVGRRLLRQGRAAAVLVLAGSVFLSWIVVALVLFVAIE